MLSLSDNEFSVISFLVRNFTERLTIRNIAQKLGFSAAGVFNILKKLEKEEIVTGERLGTGLFYSINFDNKVAEHLSSIVLLMSEQEMQKLNMDTFKGSKAAVFDNKTLLLVTDNVSVFDVLIPNVNVIMKTEDEMIALLRKKDSEMLQMLRKGIVLFGESKIVEIIKNSTSRF